MPMNGSLEDETEGKKIKMTCTIDFFAMKSKSKSDSNLFIDHHNQFDILFRMKISSFLLFLSSLSCNSFLFLRFYEVLKAVGLICRQ